MTIYKKNTEVKIVSAPCGQGKTFGLGKSIKENLSKSDLFKKNHLILLPTLELIRQVKKDLLNIHGIQDVVEITLDTVNSSVSKEAIKHFNSVEGFGNVVLMTWQGYINIPYFHNKENWNIYVDEIPQIDKFLPFSLPYNSNYILDYIEVGDGLNETLARVQVKEGCESELQKLMDRPLDDVDEVFYDLYKAILDETRDVFVDMESWYRVFERKEIDTTKVSRDKKKCNNRVFFLSMMNPTGWNGLTLMGANIEHSMLYHWFSNQYDVQFPKNDEIISHFRDGEQGSLADRLEVKYFLNDRGFSKNFGNSKITDYGTTFISDMDSKVKEIFGDQEFLYVCNNDHKSKVLDDCRKLRKIPVVAHGLNDYYKYTNIYFSAALNREPAHIRMLNSLGINNELIRKSTSYEVIYQSVMRTALRDPDSKKTVNVIVPDEKSAKRLIDIFGGGVMECIGDSKYRKNTPLTQQDYNRKCKFIKKTEGIFNKGGGLVHPR